VEYGGDGVETLSVPERATITNMGAELGVTTSIFPLRQGDEGVPQGAGREDAYMKLKADALGEVRPGDRHRPVRARADGGDAAQPGQRQAGEGDRGKEGHQVLVGSCTNASYKDVTTLARILKDRTVSPNVSFGVAPGSRQVLQMAAKESSIATLVGAGARILRDRLRLLHRRWGRRPRRAASRSARQPELRGPVGTKDAGIFLVSAETAAACALKGEMADPRDVAAELGIAYPR